MTVNIKVVQRLNESGSSGNVVNMGYRCDIKYPNKYFILSFNENKYLIKIFNILRFFQWHLEITIGTER